MKQQSNKSASNKFDDTIRQLFSLIPLIHANPGISLKTLEKQAGYKKRSTLLADLDRLTLIGTAPFSPSDFISISIEGDKVYLEFPQGLERPLDLNADEWLVLRKIIQSEIQFQKSGDENSDQLADILQKVSSIPLGISDADQNKSKRMLLKESLLDQTQIEFNYKSLSSKESELRRIDPWAVFQNKDSAYVIGFCHTRQAMRNFSLIRMEDIGLLDEAIEHQCPDNVNELVQQTAIFSQSQSGLSVRLALAPALKRVIELIFEIKSIEPNTKELHVKHPQITGNWWIAEIKISSQIWLFEILLGLGPKIVILGPDFLCSKYLQELENRPVPELLSNQTTNN